MSLLSENIKRIRTNKKVTQKQLADMTGLGISTIQGYEAGKFTPKQENLEKIAKALGVPVLQLRFEGYDREPAFLKWKARRDFLQSLGYEVHYDGGLEIDPETEEETHYDEEINILYNDEWVTITPEQEEQLIKDIESSVEFHIWKLWKEK